MDFFKNLSEIKEIAPELDAATPFLSLERIFTIARAKVVEIIGREIYDKIKNETIQLPAILTALKSSLANFMMHEHVVFSEAGKVKEKKMFKYEYEQVREKYLDYAYSYLDVLIGELDQAEDWNNSEQKEGISKLLISASDLRELGGIDCAYFYFRICNIIRDVTDDEIYPRYTADRIKGMDEREKRLLKRTVVYFTLSQAIRQYDYLELPRPLRSTLQSEFSGNNSFSKEDLDRISDTYRSRAIDIITRLESKTRVNVTDESPLSEEDKFYLPSHI